MQHQTSAMFNVSLHYAEARRRQYVMYVPAVADFDFDKVLDPAFWVHEGDRLRQDDEIIIIPACRTYRAQLIVMEAGHLFAKVALDYKRDLTFRTEDPKKLEIDMIGTQFRVRRGPAVLKDGLGSRKDAQRWIEDYTAKAA